ncbi:disulfide bond formation protein B [Candidatus Daviesbacteria bacterium]|nr:disulfide bond formation protein B [Candidatus Daviesbacteria bacterium]
MLKILKRNILYIAFFQALISTVGSLFFSEILKFPPCVLCWYQRIAMYPLVVILAIGILKKDKLMPYYVLVLSLLGFVIAFYHNLLYYSLIPEAAAPCAAGISCTTKFIQWLGFVTIPFLSLTSFAIISACAWISLKSSKEV